MYKTWIKRFLDFGLALSGLIVLAPLMLFVGLMLGLVHQGNPLFFQPRPGKWGRVFLLIKFKTMNDKTDERGQLLPDKERLTKVGAFVRSCSLDELPNLINVVKGDMSLVGPRPLLVKYLALYNPQQARRHEVLPGMTGWAQVKRCSSSFFGNFSASPYGIVFFVSISNAKNKAVRPSGASQAVTKIALIILPHGCSFVCFGHLFQNSVRASLRYVSSRHASNRSQCLARLRVAPGFRPVTLFARALYLQSLNPGSSLRSFLTHWSLPVFNHFGNARKRACFGPLHST